MKAKRIIKVEWDWVRGKSSSEFRVLSWNTSLHVVGLVLVSLQRRGELTVNLQESDEGKDLVLGGNGEGSPLLGGRKISSWVGHTSKSQGPWENKVRLNNVSNECGHSNTSVLDFGMTQEANGLFLSSRPHVSTSKVERIVELDDGVQVCGKSLKIGLLSIENIWRNNMVGESLAFHSFGQHLISSFFSYFGLMKGDTGLGTRRGAGESSGRSRGGEKRSSDLHGGLKVLISDF